MPANLTPLYYDKERELKDATTPEERLRILEELLVLIPKHKGSEKLQAQLKTKISKARAATQKKSASRGGPSHNIRRSGAGQVVVIGAPNTGKSSLIKALTGTDLKIEDTPYTTHSAHPAMMPFENIQIQLVDTPPITGDHMEVWFPDLVKNADVVLLLIDLGASYPVDNYQAVVEKLEEKRVRFARHDSEPGQQPGEYPKKTLVIATKYDLPESSEMLELIKEMLESPLEFFPTSAATGHGIEELRRLLFDTLCIVRVHSKAPGKKAEIDSPYTLKNGSTIMDMAKTVHKDFAEKLKFARIWGKHAYDGQRVNRDHVLEDEDVIELHI